MMMWMFLVTVAAFAGDLRAPTPGTRAPTPSIDRHTALDRHTVPAWPWPWVFHVCAAEHYREQAHPTPPLAARDRFTVRVPPTVPPDRKVPNRSVLWLPSDDPEADSWLVAERIGPEEARRRVDLALEGGDADGLVIYRAGAGGVQRTVLPLTP